MVNDLNPRDLTTLPKHEEKLRAELNSLKENNQKTEIVTMQPYAPVSDYNDTLQKKEGLKQIKRDLEKPRSSSEKH